MPFIRLSDDYNDHPKIDALSDGAFRLWHQGLGFCRKYQTDGLIPMSSVRRFKSYSPKRMRQLLTPWNEGANPLWQDVPGFGVKMHDFLDWNLSKEEEHSERIAATARMRKFRAGKNGHRDAVTGTVTSGVTPSVTEGVRDAFVPGRGGKDLKHLEENVDERPRILIERYRLEWYPKYRHGARLRIVGSPIEFQDAVSLCETWDDDRLEKLARIVLTTDDEFISGTDRSFHIFALKASWADDRLKQAEQGVGV